MKEPSVAALLRGGAWGDLTDLDGKIAAQQDEASKRRLQVADKVLALFETREGAEVLEYLLDRTLRLSTMPRLDREKLLISYDQLAPFATFREGQNSIVADLIDMIKAAQKRRETR